MNIHPEQKNICIEHNNENETENEEKFLEAFFGGVLKLKSSMLLFDRPLKVSTI